MALHTQYWWCGFAQLLALYLMKVWQVSEYVLGYVHKKSNREKRRRKGSTVKRSVFHLIISCTAVLSLGG